MFDLGLLGAGNMAEAIARAAIARGVLRADRITASDPSPARRELFAAMGVHAVHDNASVIASSSQLLLAVKPQTLAQVAADLAKHARPEQVIVSILAGVGARRLGDAINAALGQAGRPAQRWRIVRVMPNTPMLVGEGMAGVAIGPDAHESDADLALSLFRAGGKAVVVDERHIDAITAVSGSGPAYLFYLAEAMQQAARALGLEEHAQTLVNQTLLGAARLLAESPDGAAELRRKVTSPGGTTEAAIRHLEDQSVRGAFIDAVRAARDRSVELGR